jgi:DNA-binding CsgD family transcriptional regulator/PAS domain-containing protein
MMARHRSTLLLPDIYNAALRPEAWSAVMRSLSQLTGAIGGGYVVLSKRTNRVINADGVGISAGVAENYVQHYWKSDPYWRVMHRAAKQWLPLSRLIAEIDLSRNEWYNDFVRKLGVRELTVLKLAETSGLIACIGLQYAGQLTRQAAEILDQLKEPLGQAGLIDMEMRSRGWQAEIAGNVVEQLSVGVIVINDHGRVVEMNPVAERIVARHEGIGLRQSRVVLGRAFEAAKFEGHLAGVLSGECSLRKAARMLVGRPAGKRPYSLTLVPSTSYPGSLGRTYVIVLISDPEAGIPTEPELADLFGLSPAESRLAIALAEGKKLPEIAAEAGVKMTTLRTQMQSIFRKVGVERQSDLLLTLSHGFPGRTGR